MKKEEFTTVQLEDGSFFCPSKTVCSGTARPLAKDGRFYPHPDHDWLFIGIPSDFVIHRCDVCAADWIHGAMKKRVADYLETSYQEQRELIALVLQDHKDSLKAAKAVAGT